MNHFITEIVTRLRSIHPSLRRLTLGSLGLLGASLLLQLIDPRQVLGVSTWAKPAKFAVAVGLTGFTLGLILRQMHLSARGLRWVAGTVTWMTTLELVIITFQAARGVPSHFNNRTLFDFVLFQIAGVGIVAVTIAFVYLAVRAFRQRFDDPAVGWGIRLGLVVFLFGSAVGGIMPRPTAAQLDSLKAGQVTPLVGGHAVGIADGGPGLPVTGWTQQGGDLRIPHFVGLHALQILPLGGWLIGRRRTRPAARRTGGRLMVVGGLAYLGVTGTLLVQALRGQPLLAPAGLTPAMLATVLGAAILGVLAVLGIEEESCQCTASILGRARLRSSGGPSLPSP
jgi:hypothetical protein